MNDFLEETVEQVDKFKNYYEDHISIDHEKLIDDIDNEFEENTALWITIILVVVLILISLAIMIFVYKKSKNKNEDDDEEEEEREERKDSSLEKESGVSATSAIQVPVSMLPSQVSTTGPVSTIVQMPTAPMTMGGVNNKGLSGMNPPSYDSAMQMPQPAIAPYNPNFDGSMKF